jgi:hypothetical protein
LNIHQGTPLFKVMKVLHHTFLSTYKQFLL